MPAQIQMCWNGDGCEGGDSRQKLTTWQPDNLTKCSDNMEPTSEFPLANQPKLYIKTSRYGGAGLLNRNTRVNYPRQNNGNAMK